MLCTVHEIIALLFFQVHAVVGVLSDDADPMVTVMKLEKAPQESYADIGGLDQQIQEIKVLYINVSTKFGMSSLYSGLSLRAVTRSTCYG